MINPTNISRLLRRPIAVICTVITMQACATAPVRTCIPEAEKSYNADSQSVVFRDNLEYVLSINAMGFTISDVGTNLVVMDIQNCHNVRVNGVARARFFNNANNEIEDTMPWQTLILPPGGTDIFRTQSFSQIPASVVIEIEVEQDR